MDQWRTVHMRMTQSWILVFPAWQVELTRPSSTSHRVSAEELQAVLKAYSNGVAAQDLARQYNVDETVLVNVCKHVLLPPQEEKEN